MIFAYTVYDKAYTIVVDNITHQITAEMLF